MIVVPTLNAAADWSKFSGALLQCACPEQVLILDSASTDGTAQLALDAGFSVLPILRKEFNHGGTRQKAVDLHPEVEIFIYLTQDAVLAGPHELTNLLAAFHDSGVGAAYGRQLPRPQAGAIEAHARRFNYPEDSQVRDLASRDRYGFRSIFISNSFSAYRRSALMAVGGFPSDVVFGEDTITAAKLLLAGFKLAYVAEARVYHSHAYAWRQEFQRYFDIGVLHSREDWMLKEFGRTTGEGKRFVISELRHLVRVDPIQIPSALVRTGLKLVGYRLGRMEARIGLGVKRALSMNPGFWKK